MKSPLIVIFVISLFTGQFVYGQQAKIDSLTKRYQSTTDLAEKADLSYEISKNYINVDNEKAKYYSNKTLEHAQLLNDQIRIAHAYESQASVSLANGDTKSALPYFFQALDIYEDQDYFKDIASVTNDIANAYLGVEDDGKAEEFYQKSYAAGKITGDTNAIAVPLVGLGILYDKIGKVDLALESAEEAIDLFEGIGRMDAVVVSYVNAANYARQLNLKDKAFNYLNIARDHNEELNNQYYLAAILNAEAEWLMEDGEYAKASKLSEEAVKALTSVNAMRDVRDALFMLSSIYAESGNFEKAYHNILRYNSLKDSLNQVNNNEVIAEMNAKYDKVADEKKIAELSYQSEMQSLENDKNVMIIFIAIGGSLIMLVLVILAFVAYRQKKKSAAFLENANAIIQEKNREILDSIQYAKRIQDAIIPSSENIHSQLKDAFVFYRPKDIVAGDFYWMEKVGDTVLFAVADCTGHGVPGAMVSVVCNNALNRAVREYGLTEPAKILDKTRTLVVDTFAQSQEEVKDGMDISLCAWNKKTNKLSWAGANNPLWIIRKDTADILEIKADKQPIGSYHESSLYTNHELDLNEGDSLYLFSDGYADQFGGEKGKKFKAANLKSLLLNSSKQSKSKQLNLLENAFDDWKGDLEQLDDVCVIGVRL